MSMFNRKPGLTAQSFTTLTGLDPSYYGMVAPGRSWRARLRRWVWRKMWRLLRFTGRKGWARRRILLPWAIGAAAYLVAAIAHLVNHGWTSVLIFGGLGALPLYRWLGLPAARWTKRRGLKPVDQRTWHAVGYVALIAWTTAAAAWRLGPPMPGIWLAVVLTVWIRWVWHHRSRHEAKPVTAQVDDRQARWQKIAGSGKPLVGAELVNIVDLEGPRRWEADIDLPSGDLTVQDVMAKHRRLASLWSTRRDNVIVDEAAGGAEDAAHLTVVLENPCHEAIEYDESWHQLKNGCVPFHTYPDGFQGWLRLWLPRSGTTHAFFSGDSRSGKSAGMEAAMTQAVMTGKVWPMVGDAQGQSLPAWCRKGGGGAAKSQANTVEGIYEQLLALRDAMHARSDALQRLSWTDEDGDTVEGMSFFDPDMLGWPVILYLLDEAHLACKDPDYGKQIVALLEEIVKMAGKTGIILWLANQYPGIEELGNKMSIRQNLAAGNVVCFRNSAGSTAKQMVLPSHMPSPYGILQETPGGEHTKGTAVIYSAAPRSSRACYSRAVWVRRAHHWARIAADRIPELEPAAARALAHVTTGSVQVPAPASPATATPTPAASPVRQPLVANTDLILAYLDTRPGKWAHQGVIADAIGVSKSSAGMALRRAKQKSLVHSVRRGIWGLGPADARRVETANELVGVA